MEVGDHEPALAIDDHARSGCDRGLESGVGNPEIAAEERVLQERILLGRRRLQGGDVDDRRSGLADQRRKALLRRSGKHFGSRGLGRSDRKQPCDDTAGNGGDDQEDKQQKDGNSGRSPVLVSHQASKRQRASCSAAHAGKGRPSGAPRPSLSGSGSPFGVKSRLTELMQ